MSDHRDQAHIGLHKYLRQVDERRKQASFEVYEDDDDSTVLVELPIKYEVCGTCEGTARYVNPNIDRHGLSAEDFAEDPGFEEAYFSGAYDVVCQHCKGERVVIAIDESRLTAEQKAHLERLEAEVQDDYHYDAICAAERRFGA